MAKLKENSTNNHNRKLMADCDMTYALQMIGGRWKLLILTSLNKGPIRYGEIKNSISQITERMLTLQLKELEQDGLIIRTIFPEVPPKVEYELTELGKALIPIVKDLSAWGSFVRAYHKVTS
ncbi:winged helix-turn-helix transcriptional regulator [Leeuwenhoekiella marinoflava]|uniref:HxlR family transcriptional regulator n=2 Tax=Leeuwenhoekiella marinoflava TaxID=988 RepID=A0A4Q0PMS5_9FLAO|nr:helix-turn-helix domain-containing protein [Leeuwenhoekiella marinoflava]RXG31819.1 HxlR family transcriptional regulator [Leeuwenhoekiella marinoflava]SHF03971.1 transcriptional regulator, HxlR family [Leeuwenhoekiella marinoflava DSM 3653]